MTDSKAPVDPLKAKFYPETNAGGFSRVDGTIQFYGRVNSLIRPSDTVLDFGAGRGAWYEDTICPYERDLRLLKGKVRKVIGCDVDEIVQQNVSVDDRITMKMNTELPIQDHSIDLIVSDYVLEHVDRPEFLVKEFYRLLKDDGWLCCRTPNKYGYISVATRLVSGRRHKDMLRLAQPGRCAMDVFPTRFKMNSMGAVKKLFDGRHWDNFSYYYEAEPAYHFNRPAIFFLMDRVNRLLPAFLSANLFIFLRKKSISTVRR